MVIDFKNTFTILESSFIIMIELFFLKMFLFHCFKTVKWILKIHKCERLDTNSTFFFSSGLLFVITFGPIGL